MESLYIETIKVYNGRVYNIRYHNQRCNSTRKQLFKTSNFINLRKFINIPSTMQRGLVKCRITYGVNVEKVEFESYEMKNIKTLKLVEVSNLDYKHKAKDRTELKSAYEKRMDADDVLLIKNGLVTDTYYANVALLMGDVWYTPNQPLLPGTHRAQLVEKGKITPRNIKVDDLGQYKKIAIFNALIPFRRLIIDITDGHIR